MRLGGGVSTIRQYLQARLIDELHLAVRPIVLGEGENLFQGLDLRALGYQGVESVAGTRATHVILRRTDAPTKAGSPKRQAELTPRVEAGPPVHRSTGLQRFFARMVPRHVRAPQLHG